MLLKDLWIRLHCESIYITYTHINNGIITYAHNCTQICYVYTHSKKKVVNMYEHTHTRPAIHTWPLTPLSSSVAWTVMTGEPLDADSSTLAW